MKKKKKNILLQGPLLLIAWLLSIWPYFHFIHYPVWIKWSAFILGAAWAAVFTLDKKKNDWVFFWKYPGITSFIIPFMVTVVWGWIVAMLFILMPLNYAIYMITDKKVSVVQAQVNYVSYYKHKWSVQFMLDGESEKLYGDDPLMLEIKNKRLQAEDCVINIHVLKAPLDIYIAKDWKLQQKKNVGPYQAW